MPDRQGKLSEAERKAVNVWLEEHWKGGEPQACPVSGDIDWIVGYFVGAAQNYDGDQMTNYFSDLTVPVVCGGCGYVMQISATFMGVASIPSKGGGQQWLNHRIKRHHPLTPSKAGHYNEMSSWSAT